MALTRVITFANGKGGVGKTTVAANFAGLAALAEWKVLFVNMDPQGDAETDFGCADAAGNDHGAHLLDALAGRVGLGPVLREARPNLDVIPMGRVALQGIADLVEGKQARGVEFRRMLAAVLAPLSGRYDLIVIDTPPATGASPAVLQLVFGATRWVVIPTKADRASIGNVAEVAVELETVRPVNPGIEVLGVALFDFDTSATRILRNAVSDIEDVLDAAAPVFRGVDGEVITIRHSNAAIDARAEGKLVYELAGGERWRAAVGEGRRPERIPGSVGLLADDHLLLTDAILTRIRDAEKNILEANDL